MFMNTYTATFRSGLLTFLKMQMNLIFWLLLTFSIFTNALINAVSTTCLFSEFLEKKVHVYFSKLDTEKELNIHNSNDNGCACRGNSGELHSRQANICVNLPECF